MSTRTRTAAAGALAITVAACVSACGSGSSYSSGSSSPASNKHVASKVSAPTAQATVVSTRHDGKLGTILDAGARHMTVYLYTPDTGSSSTCTGACAAAWPPVTTHGAPTASGGASAGKLGTTTRTDGTTQVTYAGHPLYYYAKDGDSEDAYGQGVGGIWYVLDAAGAKVDTDGS
jgi:predicted lipoprotein with Yx(FWY)xxD motif